MLSLFLISDFNGVVFIKLLLQSGLLLQIFDKVNKYIHIYLGMYIQTECLVDYRKQFDLTLNKVLYNYVNKQKKVL